MFEFETNNYYYLLYLYYQILKDLGLFDNKLITTDRKIENLKDKINELIEKNPRIKVKKYYDMFTSKNAKKILQDSLKSIDIYFIIHIYIYVFKCINDIESKHDYNTLINQVYKNIFLVNINKKNLIEDSIDFYTEELEDTETLSKLYLFIFLYQTTDNKDELIKYFNFIFNKMIKDLRGIKNVSISIKYLFIINHNYDTFLQIFKAIYPNPGNMKITYDLTTTVSTITKSISREETEKQVIFNFLEKEILDQDYVDEDLYKEFIKDRTKNQSKNDVYLPNRFKMLKEKLLFFMENYLFYYYDNSLYLTLNKSQKSLIKQMATRIIFMLKEENYDTPEFRNSFNFLLSNKYTINPILYTIINIVYSYYKNKTIDSKVDEKITDEIYEIYEKHKDEDLDEKSLFNTSTETLKTENREFLYDLDRLRREEEHRYEMDIYDVIPELSFDSKIILFIQLLKSLYKQELIKNKDLYKYYSLFKSQILNIKKQQERKTFTYSVSKTKKLSTAAINRYPAISERLKSFPPSPPKSSAAKSSSRN